MCGSGESEILAASTFASKEYHLARCVACGLHLCRLRPTQLRSRLSIRGTIMPIFGRTEARRNAWVSVCPVSRLGAQFVKSGRSLDIGTATGLFPSLLSARV